eukprot:Skav211988  [mRNA]  locus=scaffold2069:89777:91931:+ [translate_table: standard]
MFKQTPSNVNRSHFQPRSPMPAAVPDTVRHGWSQSAYRSAISTFAKSGDWQSAFYLLHEMHRYEVQVALEKDEITLNSSIGATKRNWSIAMVFFVEAQDSSTAGNISLRCLSFLVSLVARKV